MSRYGSFNCVARNTGALVSAYRKASSEGGGSILLEGGTFVINRKLFPDINPNVKLYLGEGARMGVRDGLTPNVQLTLPEEYVDALDKNPTTPYGSRRLYWSSPTPPHGLDDPTQNPYGYGDMTLYVPESLEPAYREKGFSEWGTPSRRYLEIWEDYIPSSGEVTAAAASAQTGGRGGEVSRPLHLARAVAGRARPERRGQRRVVGRARRRLPLGPSAVELRQVPAAAGPQGRGGEAPGGPAQGPPVP